MWVDTSETALGQPRRPQTKVTKVHAVTRLLVKQTTGWSVLSADPLALLFVDGLDTCLIMSVINCFVSVLGYYWSNKGLTSCVVVLPVNNPDTYCSPSQLYTALCSACSFSYEPSVYEFLHVRNFSSRKPMLISVYYLIPNYLWCEKCNSHEPPIPTLEDFLGKIHPVMLLNLKMYS